MANLAEGGALMFAREARVLAHCDRCGFRYFLSELKYEIYDRQNTQKRICPACYDRDHPQLRLGERSYGDPFPARDPRVGDALDLVSPFGWEPVGSYEVASELDRPTVYTE